MQRFFVPPDRLKKGVVEFTADQAHQLDAVLRARPGDHVTVLDNAGWVYNVELSVVSRDARGVVQSRRLAPGEPRMKVTLYPALLKSDKLEYVLQKCTEVGVTAFVPVLADRCTVGSSASENRRQRWERIIAEAAEQSERGRLPQLFPVTLLGQAFEQARGLSFIAWERGERPSLRSVLAEKLEEVRGPRPFAVNLFVGPEGGFAEAEVEQARAYGLVPVSLGPRILRAETAAVVGATLILASSGDLE